MNPYLRGAGVAAAVVLLDQATKAWVAALFPVGAAAPVLPFLDIAHVRNFGVGFGLLGGGGGTQRLLLAGLAVAVALFLLAWQARPERGTATMLGATLLAGGALGNAVDRLWRGSVVDFLDLHAGGWHWPAFNVADVAITCGAALLIAASLPLGGALGRFLRDPGTRRPDR